MTDLILRDLSDGILRLTLNDPATRNSLSSKMIEELLVALRGAKARVIVIAANGPAFSSGHNLKEITAHRADKDEGRGFFKALFDSCAELMLAMIRKHHLEQRVIVQSFDFRTLKAMKKLAPEIRLSALLGFAAQDFVASGHEAGATIVSPQYKLVTPAKVKAAHDAGLQVVPWTPNTPADWETLVAAGSDAIISDDPAALIEFLKAKKPR